MTIRRKQHQFRMRTFKNSPRYYAFLFSIFVNSNSISEKNPEYANALRRGTEILKEAEYPGIE